MTGSAGPSKTVRNERTKMLAGALNTVCTSCFTVGVLAPIAAAFYNVGSSAISLATIIIGVVIWFGAAVGVHLLARRILGGIEE